MRYLAETLLLMSLATACGPKRAVVSPLPAMEGAGLSGHYSVQIEDRLYIAGGCNFPDKPLTEGGTKRFYDDIIVFDGSGRFRSGTLKLPRPSAYGACIPVEGGMMIAGGADSTGTLDNVWIVRADSVETLSALPFPLEQAAWCKDDRGTVYLGGGLSGGRPSKDVLRLGGDGRWEKVSALPAALVQGIATFERGSLCFWGGYDPEARKAVCGGYSLRLSDLSWSTLEAPVTFVGSASLDGYAVGGCDADVFTRAVNLPPEKVREYQLQPREYYRFRGQLLHRNADCEGGWEVVAEDADRLAKAGSSLARFRNGFAVSGGELKPGVRSPEVSFISEKR
ncbi:MAG: hypothetical protein MJY44_02835 [Bacteroidales bacterium]|nr:hypothetical protein [Bacteroidales bacterium]